MKYILFDIDRTLLDFDVYEQAAFSHTCKAYHIPYTDKWYHRYHEISLSLWEKHEKGEIQKERLIYQRFEMLFAEMKIEADAHSFEHTYQAQLAEGCHYIDGAIEILNYLSANYHLYVVSNGVTETQIKKIKTSQIDTYMDAVFISGEIGFQKPSKEFFDACFAKIPEFKKEEAMIIGDSLSADIRGGNIAGIKTCWFNPGGKQNPLGVNVDFEIQDLLELKGIL